MSDAAAPDGTPNNAQDGRPNKVLDQGLLEFYSSQAQLMLVQYRNIERLLGPTTDYTAPGTHCEVLLREFLRGNLPSWINVDKGFVYGRTLHEGEDRHSPEIDLLLHDTLNFRPVFRLEDFVIVQPEAVLGIIQIKRDLVTNEFRSGVKNVVDAKRHILELYYAKEGSRVRGLDKLIFSAVVGFAETPKTTPPLKVRLEEVYKEQINLNTPGKYSESIWVLPNFVGSLSGRCAVTTYATIHPTNQHYSVLESESAGKNIALQALLFRLSSLLWSAFSRTHLASYAHLSPPFSLSDAGAIEGFTIGEE